MELIEEHVAPVKKFAFETAFGDEAQAQEEARRRALEQRIADAREAGRREGFASGRAQALEEIEAQIAATLERIAASCDRLFAERAALAQAFEAQTAVLAHAIAGKLAPILMAAHPLAEIEALVSECLDACRREPRLVVRVCEALLDPLGERIERLKAGSSFVGEIVLLSDPALGPNDCRVEWPDGGAERDMASLERAIADAVRRYVTTSDEQDGQADAGAAPPTATASVAASADEQGAHNG